MHYYFHALLLYIVNTFIFDFFSKHILFILRLGKLSLKNKKILQHVPQTQF